MTLSENSKRSSSYKELPMRLPSLNSYTIQTIKEEHLTLKAQITKVKEDANNKERTLLLKIMQMKEQVEINKAAIDNHRQKHKVTNSLTYTEEQPLPLSTHNTHLRPQTHQHSSHIDTKNSTQPSKQTTNTIETQPHNETSPPSPTPTSTDSLPAQQNPTTPDTPVVLLMDSNGKFLNPEKLFS